TLCPMFDFIARLAPTPTLVPYTTLFRSSATRSTPAPWSARWHGSRRTWGCSCASVSRRLSSCQVAARNWFGSRLVKSCAKTVDRSEEHTSELQSHLNLVCRLLLEKKKQH